MHDLSFFRSNFDQVARRLALRSNPPNLDQFRELDKARRAAISEAEQLQAKVNAESAGIGKLKREGADTAALQESVRVMKSQIAGLAERKDALDDEFQELLKGIPNLPHESVPAGKSSD